MATSIVHESDVTITSRSRGLRSTRSRQRWLQLVVRTDTNLPCLNICKQNDHKKVKETIPLYKDSTRINTSYLRQANGEAVSKNNREYILSLTLLSQSEADRDYTMKIPSLFQLEQWMSKLKQLIYTDRNWFSCQRRLDDSNHDQDVLLDVNVATCHMLIIDPLVSSHDATGKAHNLLHLREFGAERDHITIYFLLCSSCAAPHDEVFLRTTQENVNRVLSQVQAMLECMLGAAQVERMPSSKCSYLVRHACDVKPPMPTRLPPSSPNSGRAQAPPPGRRPELPSDLKADINGGKQRLPPQRKKSTRLPQIDRKQPRRSGPSDSRTLPLEPSQPMPPPRTDVGTLPPSFPPLPPPSKSGPYSHSAIVQPSLSTPPFRHRSEDTSDSGNGSSGSNPPFSLPSSSSLSSSSSHHHPHVPNSPRPPVRQANSWESPGSTSGGDSPQFTRHLPPIDHAPSKPTPPPVTRNHNTAPSSGGGGRLPSSGGISSAARLPSSSGGGGGSGMHGGAMHGGAMHGGAMHGGGGGGMHGGAVHGHGQSPSSRAFPSPPTPVSAPALPRQRPPTQLPSLPGSLPAGDFMPGLPPPPPEFDQDSFDTDSPSSSRRQWPPPRSLPNPRGRFA
ncbi:uncharacterized protein LOC135829927 [Sycon ciliatum]|uniref:uncharacterized protein LOC135829927 n=1 Tax=Sycon ciliatum TaxID=27933 RepID=UPI0031F61E05